MNTQKLYKIFFKNGNSVKLAGKNFTEAFSQTGSKTPDGNIDFSLLDFYLLVPVPQIPDDNEQKYQLMLMKNKKSEWEFVQKSNDRDFLESAMMLKLRIEGFFSAAVLDLETERVISWKWSSK